MTHTNWANVLTWTRLVSVVPLSVLAFVQATTLFLAVYVVAILTDAFDGTVARLQQTASAHGATFDGVVDLVFAAFGLVWLYALVPGVYIDYWPHLLAVAGAFALFFSASYARFRTIVMPHLWLGKLSMLCFALLVPVAVLWSLHDWMVWVVVIVVIASRLEMTAFVLLGREDMDAKSVFF